MKKDLIFMKAQLPFNTTDTEELNISYYDENREKRDDDDIMIMFKNIAKLGVSRSMIFSTFSTVLDIGFGTGRLLTSMALHSDGRRCYGIEPIKSIFDKFNTTWAGNTVNVYNTDYENFEIDVKFDYIHSFFVLEHMIDPTIMFSKSAKLLKSNGKLILTCPNDGGFIPKFFKSRHAIESHRWLPDKKTVIKIAKQNGFKVYEQFTYGGFSAPRNIIKNIINTIFAFFNIGDVMCLCFEKEIKWAKK